MSTPLEGLPTIGPDPSTASRPQGNWREGLSSRMIDAGAVTRLFGQIFSANERGSACFSTTRTDNQM